MKQSFKHSWLFGLLILPLLLFKTPSMDNSVKASASYDPYQVVNGGFESGNLNGWHAFGLWKGEAGMAAFDSSLVTNGTYFTGYPYGRDGNYNLGITSGIITWDQTTERMGYLRSSNFLLGGSGWISFKLGGGRYPSFAYMSVRKVSDNTEVARFGNPNFNNTAIATTQYGSTISNAEAFLFQYYYDLTAVASLGTSLYIVLNDTAAWDWSILSADSFVTYYASAPTPGANQTATNIVPAVLGIDTADNTIKNGDFASNLDNWTVVNNTTNGWYRNSDGRARSNQSGDGDMGVIRSSAFTVTTNKYIKFDWAGGLKNDKQIFVSIKEVGTNIEKLRFVRRDNLSNKENENNDNHICDLTSLSSSVKYYAEFADARSGGWGISYIDNVRTSSNNTPAGDFAVLISGMPMTFGVDYIQEAASYGAYFLQQTASFCATLDGGSAPWTSLGNEYSTLSAAAKDYFVAGGTTETNVVNARVRYEFMITKYVAFQSNNFMVGSAGAKYVPAYANGSTYNPTASKNNSIFLIVIVGLSSFTYLTYLYALKRKSKKDSMK